MPSAGTSTSLSITNPLVLYRSLIATKKIKPDPAQHRLAIQLQDLYLRLKDYEPELDYRHRLDQAKRIVSSAQDVSKQRHEAESASFSKSGLLSSFFRDSGRPAILALTRTIPIHDSALQIKSPLGMLLYGEVGRGKSMLLDLLFTSLPSRKKRRWHFNTFMLDIFRRIELGRIQRSTALTLEHEHVVLSLAKQTIETSPILFLDEFQMPDRTSSKLLNSFMTAFFHLGGVLVASSNRMPEELAKASGVEFRTTNGNNKGWMQRVSPGQRAAKSDFGQFLEVLKARCEVWEMEGEQDWRREVEESSTLGEDAEAESDVLPTTASNAVVSEPVVTSSDAPPFYHVSLSDQSTSSSSLFQDALDIVNPSGQWSSTSLTIYSRHVTLPQTQNGIAVLPFPSLCSANLGPADYVTIASNCHTLIITSVPVLTLLQKNEARRFITFLDACYEAKCRLMIEAAAPPDKLFFPETRTRAGNDISTSKAGTSASAGMLDERDNDSITSEAFSEMYQEATSPFRPNVSMYIDKSSSSTSYPSGSARRSILADEDADFGPTYGNGRFHGASQSSSSVDMDGGPSGFAELDLRQGPDFTVTSAFTGQDEQFAYKRARSRLWEMCGRKWWDERPASTPEMIETWWTPVNREGRFWEASTEKDVETADDIKENVSKAANNTGQVNDNELFRHGASPFRTRLDPPPKFGWQHAWGMMRWGKKAGEWGKGVEGDRKRET